MCINCVMYNIIGIYAVSILNLYGQVDLTVEKYWQNIRLKTHFLKTITLRVVPKKTIYGGPCVSRKYRQNSSLKHEKKRSSTFFPSFSV